jgi:hypothetical protein
MARACGPSAGEFGHGLSVGPDGEGHLLHPRHLTDADLEHDVRVGADGAGDRGLLPQNFSATEGFTGGRVSAAMGPSSVTSCGVNGSAPAHFPARAGGGEEDRHRLVRMVAIGAEHGRAQHRAPRGVVVGPGGENRVDGVFGIGVNPSPVPEPQSLKVCRSRTCFRANRAVAIWENAQRRAGTEPKRNRLKVTDCMAGPPCVNLHLHIMPQEGSKNRRRFPWQNAAL